MKGYFHYVLAALNLTIAAMVLYYAIAYLWHVPLVWPIAGVAAMSLVLQGLYLVFKSEWLRKYYLYITMFNFMYLLLEGVAYILFCYGTFRNDAQFLGNSFEATSHKWATFDPEVGYKGVPGSFRNVKYVDGNRVYDHQSHINEQGWFSKRDYEFKKRSGVKRYAVLGDSYSSGFNVPETWIDKTDRLLPNVELYNFSMEGIGIENWRKIYFNEVKKYDLDGVIIAMSNEDTGVPDMDRPFIIMHSAVGGTYISNFDSLPDEADFEDNSILAGMLKGYAIYNNAKINEIIEQLSPDHENQFKLRAPNLYFLETVMNLTQQVWGMLQLGSKLDAYTYELQNRIPCNGFVLSLSDYKQKYPKVDMLKEIVADSKKNGMEVMLVSIPDIYNVQDHLDAARINDEMLVLSDELELEYYNGFKQFQQLPPAKLESCFYKEDLHWNNLGVNLFADDIARYLRQSTR